jgi:hypothetical protein
LLSWEHFHELVAVGGCKVKEEPEDVMQSILSQCPAIERLLPTDRKGPLKTIGQPRRYVLRQPEIINGLCRCGIRGGKSRQDQHTRARRRRLVIVTGELKSFLEHE